MLDCLSADYVADRIRNSPLRGLSNSPARIFPPLADLSSYLKLSYDPPDGTPDLIDLAYVRDSLCLICNEIISPPPPHSVKLGEVLNVMRREIDFIEIGGPLYVEGIISNMKDRVKEFNIEMQQELLEEQAMRFNEAGDLR